MIKTNKNSPSLRNRYIFLTIVIGLLVITIVSFNYRNLVTTKNSVNTAYEGVLQEQRHLEEVKNILLTINKDINLWGCPR